MHYTRTAPFYSVNLIISTFAASKRNPLPTRIISELLKTTKASDHDLFLKTRRDFARLKLQTNHTFFQEVYIFGSSILRAAISNDSLNQCPCVPNRENFFKTHLPQDSVSMHGHNADFHMPPWCCRHWKITVAILLLKMNYYQSLVAYHNVKAFDEKDRVTMRKVRCTGIIVADFTIFWNWMTKARY